MKPIILYNWKNYVSFKKGEDLLHCETKMLQDLQEKYDIVFAPGTLHLSDASHLGVPLAAQNIDVFDEYPVTGGLTSYMIKDLCKYVLLGHSERRRVSGETNEMVQKKAESVRDFHMTPIICVGETEKKDIQEIADEIIPQLKGLPTDSIIAYEPVWAVWSGEIPSVEHIQEVHAMIKNTLGANTKVLYWGSVDDINIEEILSIPGVDGVLVGRASTTCEAFSKIAYKLL